MTSVNSLTSAGLGSAAQRDRRSRILDAATALAAEGGFEQMQMRAVAARAHVALGTLYRYFPSKIHLLVTALAVQLERSRESLARRPIPGDTAADRVMFVLGRTTRSLRRDPHLTEALTRAFMFADATAADEIRLVGGQVNRMLTSAMRSGQPDDGTEPSGDEVAVAKVIGDVWLSNLVQWVTGRASADDVARSMDVAVRLLLR